MTFNPIQSIDKTLVAKRFAHARNTYGREARVQQQVAEKMLRLLMEHTGKHSAAPNSTGNTLSCLRASLLSARLRNSDAEQAAIRVYCCTPCNRKAYYSMTYAPKWKNV